MGKERKANAAENNGIKYTESGLHGMLKITPVRPTAALAQLSLSQLDTANVTYCYLVFLSYYISPSHAPSPLKF